MSKTKTGLTETPLKGTPATPRVSKISRGVNKLEPDSPAPTGRPSIERSPRTAAPKTSIDRRSPKVTTPPEKPLARVAAKGSELQAQLNSVQEDLKKAKEQIALIEKEKAQAIDELKLAQKAADEANEKLQEALVAQKRAEEDSEIEKFRALELEQAGIEATQKKQEEWQKEIESVRNQHAVDVSALLSATQELQRVKQELAMTTDAKNQALSHADDATKIAEIHADKVEILSSELTRLKALLDKKLETEANETHRMVAELTEEIEILKQELEKAKSFENKLIEKEAFIEQLNVELEAAKMAESYARSLAEEWKNRVDELEIQLQEVNKLERSASESLCSVMKQLDENNDLFHDAESEIAALKEKVGLLEMTIARQKREVEESARSLGLAKEETSEIAKKLESLKSELDIVKEEKSQALSNEKLAASSVQSLLEEKNKLITELENSKEEEEKSKKAMESLASALHEVSAEAREAKERLLSNQVEHESYENQIEDLRLVLKEANQKYETLVDDHKHEIDLLNSAIDKSKDELQNSKAEWEQKEKNLLNHVKKSEEENSSLEREIDRLVNLLKQTEEEACITREEEAHLKDNLKEVEAEVISLQETVGQSKVETMKLKESLLDKENELQNLIQENEELHTREAASQKKVEELSKLVEDREAASQKKVEELSKLLEDREAASQKKVEELSKLLEEALAKKQTEENGELSDSEKDYDMLPKVVEFSEENGHVSEEKPKIELPLPPAKQHEHLRNLKEQNNGVNNENAPAEVTKIENVYGKPKEDEKEDDSVEVEFKMWESCKIEKKEFSPERETEPESFDDDVESKAEGGESFDQINGSTENADDGGNSPSKQQSQKKKKKPLLGKFGSVFKKKSTASPK